MNATIEAQVQEMLALQDQLNTQVHPEWKIQGFAWLRAARLEAAELMEHVGWKWWKKQEPDWPQAQLECVDIWHFLLSHAIERGAGYWMLKAADAMVHLGNRHDRPLVDLRHHIDSFMTTKDLSSMIADFALMATGCGLTWEELRRQYMGKNVLNSFRASNGYKAGTYVKTWHGGQEDNVLLHRFMTENPDFTVGDLRTYLEMSYAAVLRSQSA